MLLQEDFNLEAQTAKQITPVVIVDTFLDIQYVYGTKI